MQLRLREHLLFADLVVEHGGRSCTIPDVIIDTGSGGTVVSADLVAEIGIFAGPGDRLHVLHGIGGEEVVFTRRIDAVRLGERLIGDVALEIGAVDYGYGLNGIIGLDLLRRLGAIIDLPSLELRFGA